MNDKNERSVYINGEARNNIVQTGDGNFAKSVSAADCLNKEAVKDAFKQVLGELRLLELEQRNQLEQSVTAIEQELDEKEPSKVKVGELFLNALDIGSKGNGFVSLIDRVKEPLTFITVWLGAHAEGLINLIGSMTK